MEIEQIRAAAVETCGLSTDRPVLVGVSGGPDSLCLLHALVRLDFQAVAAHFDHAFRADSQEDARKVAEMAARMGVPFVSARVDAGSYARQERLSLEEAGRVLRYRFLFEQARRFSAQAVAVGHTADDQAETLLMHLLRGAGLNGLQGMSARLLSHPWDAVHLDAPAQQEAHEGPMPLVRPLLGFWRSETLDYCRQAGLTPLFDPSNADPAFFRNRIRAELIPFLETFNPQIRPALLRTAALLSGDAAVVAAALEQAWQRCQARQEAGAVGFLREAFLAEPPGLRRALLRRAAGMLLPALENLDFRAVDRGVDWAVQGRPGQVDLVQNLRVFQEAGWLWLARVDARPGQERWPRLEEEEMRLPAPGALDFPGGWRLECGWQALEDPQKQVWGQKGPWQAWLDAGALAEINGGQEPLELRVHRWSPGDRFLPLGMDGQPVKLSDFWTNAKLPALARRAWPLVSVGDVIIWIPGFRPAHPGRVVETTRRVLYLRMLSQGALPSSRP